LHYYINKYRRVFPRNGMNWRTSAHYIEISHIYTIEMMKKYSKIYDVAWDKFTRENAR
jgi:hypothetical protein